MTEDERKYRISYLIFQADRLMVEYDFNEYYRMALEESVEAINCRAERLAKRAA